MSLRLRQAIPGKPTQCSRQNLGVGEVDDALYIAYTSATNVVVLDTELELAHTLSFWTALPYRASSSTDPPVQGVVASQDLIIAWSGTHIVLWQHSSQRTTGKGKEKAGWSVHSTLLAGGDIKCLDFRDSVLVLGTEQGIELWRFDPDGEVIVWDRVFQRAYTPPRSIRLSAGVGHIAWFNEGQRSVHILTLGRNGNITGIQQELRHPRDLSWIGWRTPRSPTGDAHLYTITSNSVFRIYSPVLDDPAWFQLHSTLDGRVFAQPSAAPQPKGKGKTKDTRPLNPAGVIWPMDGHVLQRAVTSALESVKQGRTKVGEEVRRMLDSLSGEESDVIAWIGEDGTLSLRSIINLDRKPPTLLKSLPLSRTTLPPGMRHRLSSSSQLSYESFKSKLSCIVSATPTDPIRSFPISLPDLLASAPTTIAPHAPPPASDETTLMQLNAPLKHFFRTPNGRGLLALTSSGEMATWSKLPVGHIAKGQISPKALLGKAHWNSSRTVIDCAIFAKGRAIVLQTVSDAGKTEIALQHIDDDATEPSPPLAFPSFELDDGDSVEMLLAVSDIDDGFSAKGRKTQRAIVIAASQSGVAWVWRVFSAPDYSDLPELKLMSKYRLPSSATDDGPHLVMPVDPMGWHQSVIDWSTDTPLQDMVLTISTRGVLEFWTPRIGHHLASDGPQLGLEGVGGVKHLHSEQAWTRSGVVETKKSNIVQARCSSRKKTVLVCELPDGRHELTIWDSNVSEFSTGLEHTYTFSKGETIQDLDWTTTSDLQSVLAVGFPHRVVLVCEQRMSYVDISPGWAPFITIDLEQHTSNPICDSIWLAGGSLAVGCGNQVYLFSRFLDRGSPAPSPSASAKGVNVSEEPEDIFQLIAHENGPLVDYHPTVLAQCILWDKIDLVKRILITLSNDLRTCEEEGKRRLVYTRLDPSAFFNTKSSARSKVVSRKYESLFDVAPIKVEEEDTNDFNEKIVADLVDRLDGPVGVPLSHSEKSLLATIAQATLEVEEQRRSLDLCGLRYLISIRMFVNQNRRSGLSGTVTPASGSATPGAGGAHSSRLSFRNIVWATHSESQDILLAAATACCREGKMLWADAKRLGVFLWLSSADTVKAQLEVIARNRFMQDEDRDPTVCSLIFFALGKKKVVHGLWRQAPGHKEQNMMLKFLANDFELERWRTAAAKNAYALLSKQRYEYAAAFFMLSGAAKDAINVCLRQLNDWQLALALARAIEGGNTGPLVKGILSDTVIPMAFEGGHRWLATWAFWVLGRRDLAVRILISPMTEVASAWSQEHLLAVGMPENDDPSLLLLFQHLKSRSLQTAKGTSEVPARMEWDFVLHNARVFYRMGCHSLGLDLLRSWSFERAFFPLPKPKPSKLPTPLSTPGPSTPGSSPNSSLFKPRLSPNIARRRPSFMLSNGGRRESMVMDMDILAESAPPTRPASPTDGPKWPITSVFEQEPEAFQPNGDGVGAGVAKEEKERKEEPEPPRKMGNLMKELKQDVQQGAMEFNMDSFDF